MLERDLLDRKSITKKLHVMGILDSILKNADMLSDVGKLASENPQITKALINHFNTRDTSVGDEHSLGGILARLESGGLDDVLADLLGDGVKA